MATSNHRARSPVAALAAAALSLSVGSFIIPVAAGQKLAASVVPDFLLEENENGGAAPFRVLRDASASPPTRPGRRNGSAVLDPAFVRDIRRAAAAAAAAAPSFFLLPPPSSSLPVEVQTTLLTSSSDSHVDYMPPETPGGTRSPATGRVAFIPLAVSGEGAHFDHGDTCIPLVEGSLMHFGGDVPHRTVIPRVSSSHSSSSVSVHLLGPFELDDFKSVGDPPQTCADDPCRPGETCVTTSTGNGNYYCNCTASPCDSNDCDNDETCFVTGTGCSDYDCQCNNATAKCDPNPCPDGPRDRECVETGPSCDDYCCVRDNEEDCDPDIDCADGEECARFPFKGGPSCRDPSCVCSSDPCEENVCGAGTTCVPFGFRSDGCDDYYCQCNADPCDADPCDDVTETCSQIEFSCDYNCECNQCYPGRCGDNEICTDTSLDCDDYYTYYYYEDECKNPVCDDYICECAVDFGNGPITVLPCDDRNPTGINCASNEICVNNGTACDDYYCEAEGGESTTTAAVATTTTEEQPAATTTKEPATTTKAEGGESTTTTTTTKAAAKTKSPGKGKGKGGAKTKSPGKGKGGTKSPKKRSKTKTKSPGKGKGKGGTKSPSSSLKGRSTKSPAKSHSGSGCKDMNERCSRDGDCCNAMVCREVNSGAWGTVKKCVWT